MLKNSKTKPQTVLIMLSFIAITALAIDINTGYTSFSMSDFVAIINGSAPKATTFALMELRLPRILTAILVGVGLSSSGCILQGVSRNELADPGILGINAGAAFMVSIYVCFFSSSLQNASYVLPIIAFVGAAITAVLVYVLSHIKNEGISPNRLVLTGVAISAAISSGTVVLLLKMRHDDYGFVEGWISGNIWGASWSNIKMMLVCIGLFFTFALFKSRTLNVLTLGTQTAIGLGVSIQRQSLVLLTAAVGLSSICVAVGGGIVFVGLICPHLARKLVGPRHQVLLPASALCGAALLAISDIISRTILSPNEVSIGIVVAVIGSPYFLYLLAKSK